MDSGNSGSLQSSSGGDEEYESRAADYVFMTGSGNPIPNAPAQFIDPLSGYLQLHQNPNSLLLNSSNPLRSDPYPNSMFPVPAPFTTASPLSNSHHQQAAPNPKKRSRASRRAPTTVLTTDTTNFRAMVQEFTGIPAPPFNSSSSFPRTRLDFFASRSNASLNSAQPPPSRRRPFASTSINYPLPNLFNIPNQNQNQNILTSLLQSNTKFPFPTASKPQNSFQNNDRFVLNHHNQISETLPNLIPSDHNHNDFQRNAIGGKIGNFSSSSTSGFHGGKSPENNVRGEGMVESWICSSE
ncbi:autism susceptibility gene 2 protein [Salvia divinorum]|uniref:Autism susceptibility gene 2 protein n=1 Tax=Salvia divinorum TaxID=28513 RepID=A0ABD1FYI9_SALDI